MYGLPLVGQIQPQKALSPQDVKVLWLLKPDQTRCNVGAQNHLQTTWLLDRVLYSVEQPPHCDLLRLSPCLDDLFPHRGWLFSCSGSFIAIARCWLAVFSTYIQQAWQAGNMPQTKVQIQVAGPRVSLAALVVLVVKLSTICSDSRRSSIYNIIRVSE
jgi:hypothetical protein